MALEYFLKGSAISHNYEFRWICFSPWPNGHQSREDESGKNCFLIDIPPSVE